jgi:hypothetical protein
MELALHSEAEWVGRDMLLRESCQRQKLAVVADSGCVMLVS